MLLPLRSLLVPVVLLATMPSCEINLGYRIVSDGYRFDYEGASARRDDAGELPEGLDHLEVDHRFGEVRVTGADDVAPGWTWAVEVWADSELEAELIADELAVVQRAAEDGIRLELEIPEGHKRDLRGVRSTLFVTVPSHSDLVLQSRHGDARITSLDGRVRLETRHGDVHLEALRGAYAGDHAHGELFATSIANGALSVEHGAVVIRGAGPIEARTRHADSSFDGIDGDLRIDARHSDVEVHGAALVEGSGSHGRWRVADVSGVHLRSQHGDVDARLARGAADIEVEHGDVTVERSAFLDGSHGSTLVRCAHGDVEVDLPPGARAEIAVSHGDAVLRHAAEPGSTVYVDAGHGDVGSDLPTSPNAESDSVVATIRTSYGDVRCARVAVDAGF